MGTSRTVHSVRDAFLESDGGDAFFRFIRVVLFLYDAGWRFFGDFICRLFFLSTFRYGRLHRSRSYRCDDLFPGYDFRNKRLFI